MKSLMIQYIEKFAAAEKNHIRKLFFRTKRDLRKMCDSLKSSGIECDAFEYHKQTKKWDTINWTTVCRICGRQLSDPESVQLGIGPDCRKKKG